MPPRQPGWFQEGRRTSVGNGRGSRLHEAAAAKQQQKLALRYVLHQPWDLRLNNWLAAKLLLTPWDRSKDNNRFWRYRMFKFWLANLYPRFRSLVVAVCGPRVDGAERLRTCRTCDRVKFRLPKRPGGRVRLFCRQCGCPDWFMSELHRKTRLAKATCPAGLWSPAEPDWQSDFVERMERARHAKTTAAADTAPADPTPNETRAELSATPGGTTDG